jgi:hypothetical protein
MRRQLMTLHEIRLESGIAVRIVSFSAGEK